VAVVFVLEVGDVAICCFVLVLWLEDVQLLHVELLGISVLCYVLPRVVVLVSALGSAQAVATAVVLLDARLAVVSLQAKSGVA
jgi:hypothetical protein